MISKLFTTSPWPLIIKIFLFAIWNCDNSLSANKPSVEFKSLGIKTRVRFFATRHSRVFFPMAKIFFSCQNANIINFINCW